MPIARILLVSNSTVHRRGYLDHVEPEIKDFVGPAKTILFFPFASFDREDYAATAALQASDVCVTCTTARNFFVNQKNVSSGTFIAAVGADNDDKQEIDPN